MKTHLGTLQTKDTRKGEMGKGNSPNNKENNNNNINNNKENPGTLVKGYWYFGSECGVIT